MKSIWRTSQFRFLAWLGTFAGVPTTLGKLSTIVYILERKGFIEREGMKVALTKAGRAHLIANGWEPGCDEDGNDTPFEPWKR